MSVVDKNGDIFETEAQVIGHGVNIRGLMGAGIAKTVRHLYPSVFREYRDACENETLEGGECLLVKAEEWDGDEPRYIANISSQINPGANASLDLLRKGLEDTFQQLDYASLTSLALPRIGAGIGGLVWEDALEVIKEVSENYPEIEVEVWTYSLA